MTKEKSLEEAIKELYIRAGYGRVLKSEIDALVFHYFLLENLKQKPLYFIDKKDIFELSGKLRVSESKIKRLLEDDYLLNYQGDQKTSAVEILRHLVPGLNITRESIKDGRLRLPVANPIARKILEVEIYNTGGIADTSFNREILVIGLFDFFKLLGYSKEAEQSIKESLKAKLTEKGETQKTIDTLLRKPAAELVKDAAGVLVKFLGAAAGEVLTTVTVAAIERFLSAPG
jgi:hypothetical protein